MESHYSDKTRWAFILALVVSTASCLHRPIEKSETSIRIGYFHGGRTALFFRAYINGYFEKESVKVDLITKNIRTEDYFTVPRENWIRKTKNDGGYGKATGAELLERMFEGKFEGATIGETAFLRAIEENKNLVAVASLGEQSSANAGLALCLRTGIKIRKNSDFRGLRLAARRSSGGDEVLLREFILSMGLDPDKDVKIISNAQDDQIGDMITAKSIDGGLFHLYNLKSMHQKKLIYVYQSLDKWVNSTISMALLVFPRSFVAANREKIGRILLAYRKRVRDENKLEGKDRLQDDPKLQKKGLEIDMVYEDMTIPRTRENPTVPVESLKEMQALLTKHRVVTGKVQLSDFVDNSILEESAPAPKELQSR